jgi:hypothetical protein
MAYLKKALPGAFFFFGLPLPNVDFSRNERFNTNLPAY